MRKRRIGMVPAAPRPAGRPAGGAAQPPPPPAARALAACGRRLSCLASLRPNFSPLSLRRHHVTSPRAIGWPLYRHLHIHEEGELLGRGPPSLAGAALGPAEEGAVAGARRGGGCAWELSCRCAPRLKTWELRGGQCQTPAVGLLPAPW